MWGKYLERLEAQAAAGREVRALESRPEPDPALQPIWRAFIELHNRRQTGFGINPISLPSIISWLDINGFHDLDIRRWIYDILIEVDNSWIKRQLAKQESKKKGK